MNLIDTDCDEYYTNEINQLLDELYPPTQETNEKLCDCDNDIIIDGFYTCNNCGIVNTNRINYARDFEEERKILIYKRRHYFSELLKNFQGQIQPNMPEEYYEIIKNKCNDNPNNLKNVLKQLKLTKYVEKINFIKWKIWNIQPPHIPTQKFCELLEYFIKIEKSFRQKRIKLSNKKKFLSYNLVLKILFLAVGLPEYSIMIPPLKSHVKNEIQSRIIINLLLD